MIELPVEENIEDILTPKQERFCLNYTQNIEFYGNATSSYADAYEIDLYNLPKDDSIWLLKDGTEVSKRELDIIESQSEARTKGARIIKDSTYQKAYDYCSKAGSRLRRNGKIQKRCRDLLNELMLDDVIDARLIDIILKGANSDSISAIKEYNKLKQRITDKQEIEHKGSIAGFNFIRNDEGNKGNKTDNQTNS